ncbi:hypothetical protein QF000_000804 [Paraburkholderia atlantica]|uniref:Uncharacterized protein n=2 Tax=Paraburkholderia TaxID=1822464 RepID=A0A7W8P8F7_9BURK|nr:hypothetical protein [Paraburkholderia youngii]MBB5421508.1 hypothetical protein [Paraburkholderia atlantica]MBB5429437.1 hypothetical protein [Paraburkholderia atlantica]
MVADGPSAKIGSRLGVQCCSLWITEETGTALAGTTPMVFAVSPLLKALIVEAAGIEVTPRRWLRRSDQCSDSRAASAFPATPDGIAMAQRLRAPDALRDALSGPGRPARPGRLGARAGRVGLCAGTAVRQRDRHELAAVVPADQDGEGDRTARQRDGRDSYRDGATARPRRSCMRFVSRWAAASTAQSTVQGLRSSSSPMSSGIRESTHTSRTWLDPPASSCRT